MTQHLIHWRGFALHAMVGATVGMICQQIWSRVVVKSVKICRLWHIALWWPRYANVRPNHFANGRSWQIRSRVVAKSAGSGDSVLHCWMCYLMDCRFKMADFQTEKRVPDHQIRPKLLLHGLISITISWHCSFKFILYWYQWCGAALPWQTKIDAASAMVSEIKTRCLEAVVTMPWQ
jgi:hypothetical protein